MAGLPDGPRRARHRRAGPDGERHAERPRDRRHRARHGTGRKAGIAPAAKQQGKYAVGVIRGRLSNAPSPTAFRYRHLGNLATIGPSAAVIELGRIRLKGWLAWWIWGLAHIYFLIGTRSRLAVAMSWLWTAVTGLHSARLITQKETLKGEV
jgi:NADH dehydrogenase